MTILELATLILSLVKTLESIPYKENSRNIGAWRGQLVGNSAFGYACKLEFKCNIQKKVLTVALPSGFIPSVRTKITEYYNDFIVNDDKLPYRVLTFLAYTIGVLYCGKTPSTISIGRGKIISEFLDKAQVTELLFTVYKWSSGGSKEITTTLNLEQLKLICALQVNRYDELVKECGNPTVDDTTSKESSTTINPDVVITI